MARRGTAPHIAEEGIDSADKVVGTGPWAVDTSERDNFVTSKPNPNYHRNAPDGSPFPYLDAITSIQFPETESAIAALKTGRIDLLSEQNVESTFNIEKDEGDALVYQQWINPGLTRLALNNTKPPFDDVRAREAGLPRHRPSRPARHSPDTRSPGNQQTCQLLRIDRPRPGTTYRNCLGTILRLATKLSPRRSSSRRSRD